MSNSEKQHIDGLWNLKVRFLAVSAQQHGFCHFRHYIGQGGIGEIARMQPNMVARLPKALWRGLRTHGQGQAKMGEHMHHFAVQPRPLIGQAAR